MKDEKEEIEEARFEEKVSQEWEEIVTSESDRLKGMEERVKDEIGNRYDFPLFSLLKKVKNSFGRLVGNLNTLQRYAVSGGAVAAVLLGLLLGWFITPSTGNGHKVVFKLPAQNAKSVNLAGDFSGYEPIKMKDENSDGVWTVRLDLEEGKYEYYYMVNGEEKVDSYPLADKTVRDWDNSKNGIRFIDDDEEDKRKDGVSTA